MERLTRRTTIRTTNYTTINLDLLSLLLCGREDNDEVNANRHPIYGAASGGIVYLVAVERTCPLLTSCPSFTNHPTIQPPTNPPNQATPAWQSPPSRDPIQLPSSDPSCNPSNTPSIDRSELPLIDPLSNPSETPSSN